MCHHSVITQTHDLTLVICQWPGAMLLDICHTAGHVTRDTGDNHIDRVQLPNLHHHFLEQKLNIYNIGIFQRHKYNNLPIGIK